MAEMRSRWGESKTKCDPFQTARNAGQPQKPGLFDELL
jgi:hypothetical protein